MSAQSWGSGGKPRGIVSPLQMQPEVVVAEPYEDEKEELSEPLEEEMEEGSEDESERSHYKYFDENWPSFFAGFCLPGERKTLEVVIPAECTLSITGVSLAAKNTSQARHVITMRDGQSCFVLARLRAGVCETQQADIQCCAEPHERKVQFLLEGEGVGDVHIVGILYRPEEEESGEEGEEELSDEEKEEEIQEKPSLPKEEEKARPKVQGDDMYRRQSEAKAAEHKMDRALNKTLIEYKDLVQGTGKTAMPRMTARISLRACKDSKEGKVLDETPEGKYLQFKIGAGDVSRGLERVVLGMRVGGTREATGPGTELIGEGMQDKIWMQIRLVGLE